jgi:hypothetical protein
MVAMIMATPFLVALSKRQKKLWRQFAFDNGWKVGIPSIPYAIPPTMLTLPSSRLQPESISGVFQDKQFNLMIHSYTVGQGKHRRIIDSSVLQVQYLNGLPPFIIDSKTEKISHTIPDAYEELNLEGDFNQHFKLFVPTGTQIEVLSIITPDVMRTLIDHCKGQDIESLGNLIWYIDSSSSKKDSEVRSLFAAAHALGVELDHRAKSYRPTEVISSQTIALAQTGSNEQAARSLGFYKMTRARKILLAISLFVILSIVVPAFVQIVRLQLANNSSSM